MPMNKHLKDSHIHFKIHTSLYRFYIGKKNHNAVILVLKINTDNFIVYLKREHVKSIS